MCLIKIKTRTKSLHWYYSETLFKSAAKGKSIGT